MGGRSSLSKLAHVYGFQSQRRRFSPKPGKQINVGSEDDADVVPTAGISRPLSDILKDLNKKVPDSLLKGRTEPSGFSLKYIPWHALNRILNLHAPEWSGEVRSISYSPDATLVSVVYRVTLYGTDAEIRQCLELSHRYYLLDEQSRLKQEEFYGGAKFMKIFRESTGTASLSDTSYGGPVQKAEAMAFRRACSRLGLGLHLYHEDQE